MKFIFIIIFYLLFAVIYNQSFKLLANKMNNAGALIVILDGLAGIFSLILIPFFEFKLPSNKLTYLFLSLACIFYALNDRLSTTSRKGLEASGYSILKQLSTVFMIFIGIIIFNEKIVFNKLVGAFIIIFSNVLLFYNKKSFKFNKYVLLGILASLCNTAALFIDVSYSNEFCLPFYVSFTLIVPTILIFIFDKIKIRNIKQEYKLSNKKYLWLAITSSSFMLILKLIAYNIENVLIVAPLCSLTIILNVLYEMFFLKNKENYFKKIISAILIVISIILIKL